MAKNKVVVIFIVIAVILAGGAYEYFNQSAQREQETPAQEVQDTGDGKDEQEVVIDPINILILGLDDRDDDYTGRTDTIMVAGINPENEAINLISIPRDTRVKIKGAYDKINAAYVYGGPELARETVEDFLDIEIDHYIVVNFKAFEEMVDLVGGIEVDVPIRMEKKSENIDLYPGKQLLNGEQALGYARFRGTAEGDLGRAKRQQEVIELLMQKVLQPRSIIKLPEMIRTVYEHVRTDYPLTKILEIVQAANQIKTKPLNASVLPGENKKLLVDAEKNLQLWYYIADEEKLPEISQMFK